MKHFSLIAVVLVAGLSHLVSCTAEEPEEDRRAATERPSPAPAEQSPTEPPQQEPANETTSDEAGAGLSTTPSADPTDSEQGDPEQAVRQFLAAMIANDKEAVRATTLPHEDAEVLWSGEELSAEQRQQMEAMMREMPVRRLEPGEEVALGNGRTITVPQMSEDHAMVLMNILQGQSMPLRVERRDGRWKVDAEPLIAARKAADRVRLEQAPQSPLRGSPDQNRPDEPEN